MAMAVKAWAKGIQSCLSVSTLQTKWVKIFWQVLMRSPNSFNWLTVREKTSDCWVAVGLASIM